MNTIPSIRTSAGHTHRPSLHIREALPDDVDELQDLQARCPVGTGLTIAVVNTPDFFARARAYASSKVYVACTDSRIVGSAACATRNALIAGQVHRVGYEFQYFTSPEVRRMGVAAQLHERIESDLTQQGVALSYALVMEGNVPSMRLFERLGFELYRTPVMLYLLPFKRMDVPSLPRARRARLRDLAEVAELLNETWRDYDLYEPATADTLARFVERTPHYTLENLVLLEDRGKIVACLGFWDLSLVTQVTVQELPPRLRMICLLFDVLRTIRPMPRSVWRGTVLKQWCLTPMAFKAPEHLANLFRYVNNLAVLEGIDQLFVITERPHILTSSMRGLLRTSVSEHLYIKRLQAGALLSDRPAFLDALDL